MISKLFPSGTIEHIVRQKTYTKDKRKKVKLVSIIDRGGSLWYYLFVGTKWMGRTKSISVARTIYEKL